MNFFITTTPIKLFLYLFFVPAIMIVHSSFFFDSQNAGFHTLIEVVLVNVFLVIYGIWFYNLSSNLRVSVFEAKISRFLGFNFIFLIIYTVVINFFIIRQLVGVTAEMTSADIEFFDGLFPLMLVMQAYSTILYMLTLYIMAKVIIKHESGNPGGLKPVLSLVVLFVASPIGVWFIQPRIQKIFSGAG